MRAADPVDSAPVGAGCAGTLRQLGVGEAGSVTVEAAIALGAIAVTAMLCVGAVFAAVTQVRCVDAAREAARLAARGDRVVALDAARRVAPDGAEISLRDDNDRVIALVVSGTPLLPALELRAEAVAVKEPGPHP